MPLGRHTDSEIDQRLRDIQSTLDGRRDETGKEWECEKRELEDEARNLQTEKEGNRIIGSWLAGLNATGQNSGLKLSDFVLTDDPINDLGSAARAAGESASAIADIIKSAAVSDLVGTVIAGQIYLLQTSDVYQASKAGGMPSSGVGAISSWDVALYGGSWLSHENYHKQNGRSEYDAYSFQEKVLDNMNKSNSPFKNQKFFENLQQGIQGSIKAHKKAERR